MTPYATALALTALAVMLVFLAAQSGGRAWRGDDGFLADIRSDCPAVLAWATDTAPSIMAQADYVGRGEALALLLKSVDALRHCPRGSVIEFRDPETGAWVRLPVSEWHQNFVDRMAQLA